MLDVPLSSISVNIWLSTVSPRLFSSLILDFASESSSSKITTHGAAALA